MEKLFLKFLTAFKSHAPALFKIVNKRKENCQVFIILLIMAEVKAKKKLQESLQRWNPKVSSDQVILIFKNSEKYTLDRQQKILVQLFSANVAEFQKLSSQFEVDVKKNKKTPYEAFLAFVLNMTANPVNLKPQIATKPNSSSDSKLLTSTKSDFESPALSSTRLDANFKPDVIVSEVRSRKTRKNLIS